MRSTMVMVFLVFVFQLMPYIGPGKATKEAVMSQFVASIRPSCTSSKSTHYSSFLFWIPWLHLSVRWREWITLAMAILLLG